MAGIYFHIPFCKRICAYCDFARTADLRRMPEAVGAMHRELDERRGFLHDRRIRTLYFGGGTPSLLDPAEFGRFAEHAARLFDATAVEECTVEANPDDLTAQYLRELRRTPVNRLSIGVQSFDDAALRFMNRRHTAAEAVDAVRRAQDAGFGNITVDLIFGIDGFGGEILDRNIGAVLSLGVQHVSAYHLTIESGTAFGRRAARGELRAVDEGTSEREFLALHRALTEAGYEHYEVSNYARPGFRARHNSSYWRGDEYLGIGAGAHSFDGRVRRWAAARVEEYLAGRGGGEESLTETDRRNETVMTALRTSDGLSAAEFAGTFGEAAAERLLRAAKPWLDAGTLLFEGGVLRIPAEKFLVSDSVIESLFEV